MQKIPEIDAVKCSKVQLQLVQFLHKLTVLERQVEMFVKNVEQIFGTDILSIIPHFMNFGSQNPTLGDTRPCVWDS